MTHPELPSCTDCQTWIYDDRWQQSTRGGQPLKRPPHVSPPCSTCPKIPKDEKPEPRNAVGLSEQNEAVYAHYLRCKAVSRFPEDAIVERHAGLIRMVEDDVAAARQEQVAVAIGTVMSGLAIFKRGR